LPGDFVSVIHHGTICRKKGLFATAQHAVICPNPAASQVAHQIAPTAHETTTRTPPEFFSTRPQPQPSTTRK
jgi:hypothetical protein